MVDVLSKEEQKVIVEILGFKAQGGKVDVVMIRDAVEALGEATDAFGNAVVNAYAFITEKEWKKVLHEQSVKKKLGFVPGSSVLTFVERYIEHNKVDVRYNGLMTKFINGEKFDFNTDDLRRELRLKVQDCGLPFTDTNISDAVAETVAGVRYRLFKDCVVKVAHSKEANASEWNRLVAAIVPRDEEVDEELVKAVFQSFFWQIKRKMNNLPVDNHIMPILAGKQGGGKSLLIKKLLEVIADMVANTDFGQVADQRNIDLWKNYVLYIGEMAFASKSDIDTIKNAITCETLSRRPMKTNDYVQVRQCATFIGDTNKDVSELIRDETGIRRFAEVRVRDVLDWEVVNSLDTLALWQSVDENAKNPILNVIDRLRAQQEEKRNKSVEELWCMDVKRGDVEYNKDELYLMFCEWCDNNGHRAPTSVMFLNHIGSMFRNGVGGIVKRKDCAKGFRYSFPDFDAVKPMAKVSSFEEARKKLEKYKIS